MAWKDWLRDDMIPNADMELIGLNGQIVSSTNAITHYQKWEAIYLGIQGECKANLEAQLGVKGAYWGQGYRYDAWQPNHSYSMGNIARPTIVNNRKYEVTYTPFIPYEPPQYNPEYPWEELFQRVSGTSGPIEPTWPLTAGGTVVDNNITWTCRAIPITYIYGAGYGTTNLTAWDVRDSGVIVYSLSVNWDGDAIITKAMADWNTMDPLLHDLKYGVSTTLGVFASQGVASTVVNWRNAVAARNPILGDYDD